MQWEGASALLLEIVHQSLLPNIISWSAAISACARGKYWEVAFRLLEEMMQETLKPNVVSCNSTVGACEKGEY